MHAEFALFFTGFLPDALLRRVVVMPRSGLFFERKDYRASFEKQETDIFPKAHPAKPGELLFPQAFDQLVNFRKRRAEMPMNKLPFWNKHIISLVVERHAISRSPNGFEQTLHRLPDALRCAWQRVRRGASQLGERVFEIMQASLIHIHC